MSRCTKKLQGRFRHASKPPLTPIAVKFGIDPIHCIIMVLNFGIGGCTPPVGISLMVGCGIGGVNIEQSILLPFYLVRVLVLFPVLSLGLLELMK